MVASCQDEWRTEYRPCDGDSERCVADDLLPDAERSRRDGCYWTAPSAACKLDTNWQRVMKCADPRLPVAKFSIVDVRGILIACEGARDCNGVDTKAHDLTMTMLVSFVNQLKDTRHVSPEYVNVGSFVGNLGFALSRQGVKVHLFEPVPSTRQWLKITRCFGQLDKVKIYEHGIGTSDEDCAISPEANILAGNVNVTCPAHPVANRQLGTNRFDIIVPFRTFDTVYRQWVFDTEAANHNVKAKEPQRVFIVHFDDSVDPLPLISAAPMWFSDASWRPATVIMSSAHVDGTTADGVMAEFGYTPVRSETELPYRVYAHD
jgi:hypothetical protein